MFLIFFFFLASGLRQYLNIIHFTNVTFFFSFFLVGSQQTKSTGLNNKVLVPPSPRLSVSMTSKGTAVEKMQLCVIVSFLNFFFLHWKVKRELAKNIVIDPMDFFFLNSLMFFRLTEILGCNRLIFKQRFFIIKSDNEINVRTCIYSK